MSETDRVIARQRDRFGEIASAVDATRSAPDEGGCGQCSVLFPARRTECHFTSLSEALPPSRADCKTKRHKGLQRWRPCTHSRNRESKTAEPFVPFFGHRKSKGRWAWAATETLGGTHSRCKEGCQRRADTAGKSRLGRL